MKRTLMTLVLAAAALLSAGCYVSLHPLVTDDVRVFEPALVGTWQEADDAKNTWTFKPATPVSPTRYEIEITEDGQVARFSGKLARIDGLLVLDLEPGDNDDQCSLLGSHDWLQMHLVGVHSFLKIGLDGDSLSLSLVDAKWLDRAIADRTVRIAHERIDDDSPGSHDGRVLLTASPPDLQALVRAHGRSGLFDESDPGRLVRKR